MASFSYEYGGRCAQGESCCDETRIYATIRHALATIRKLAAVVWMDSKEGELSAVA